MAAKASYQRTFSQVGKDVKFRGIKEDEEESEIDESELEGIEETILERMMGLSEMVPDRVWEMTGKSIGFSYWLLRRSAWIIGTSLSLLLLPVFVEEQRLEVLNMQEMHTKQVMLGQGGPPGGPRAGPGMLPPQPRPM